MDHSQFYMTPEAYEISALRRRIEEMERELRKLKGIEEPVAYFDPQKGGFYWAKPTKIEAPVTVNVDPLPLYTIPQRTWVGLDINEFKFIASKYLLNREVGLEYFQEEIEDKLKELNT